MRIEIETDTESSDTIRATANLLTDLAERRADTHTSAPPPPPLLPLPTDSHILVGGARESITGDNPPPPPPPPPPASGRTTDNAELDGNLFPWDERIHASTKTKTREGHWKYKRNLAMQVRLDVEEELRGVQASAPAPEHSSPKTMPAPMFPAPAEPAPTPPPLAPLPGSVLSIAGEAPLTHITPSQIIARVSELRAMEKLSDSRLAEICTECGMEGMQFITGQDEATCAKFATMLEVDTE